MGCFQSVRSEATLVPISVSSVFHLWLMNRAGLERRVHAAADWFNSLLPPEGGVPSIHSRAYALSNFEQVVGSC